MKIDFLIPLSDTESLGEAIIFQQWLPDAEADALTKEEGDYVGRLWIDRECLGHWIAPEDVARHQNILISKVRVEIQVKNVSEELLQFIYTRRLFQ